MRWWKQFLAWWVDDNPGPIKAKVQMVATPGKPKVSLNPRIAIKLRRNNRGAQV